MSGQLEITKDERYRILRELPTAKCFCGAKKTPNQTFCKSHYFGLPKPMRDALYDRFGEGYEEAYTAARKYLEAR